MTDEIDLNCDLGESYGAFVIGDDAGIMPYISSANIACGFHGGDPTVIRRAVRLATKHGVAIGAHPAYPDLVGFGLRRMDIDAGRLEDLVLYQIAAVAGIASAENAELHHVKPHGALYMAAARDRTIADAVARAVAAFDAGLVLYGIGEILPAARAVGLKVAAEAFAGRLYEADGWPRTRARSDAFLDGVDASVEQIRMLVSEQKVRTVDASVVPLPADTVCVHVENAGDVHMARQLRAGLEAAGIRIVPRHRV